MQANIQTNAGKTANNIFNGPRPKTRGGAGRIKPYMLNKPATVAGPISSQPPKLPRNVVKHDRAKEMVNQSVDTPVDTTTKHALSRLEAPSIYHYSNYKAYLRAFEAYLKFLSRMNYMVNKFDHNDSLRTTKSLEDLSVDDTFCPVMTGVDSSLYDKVQAERTRKYEQQEQIRALKIQLLQKSNNSSGVKVIQSSVETIKDTEVISSKTFNKRTGEQEITSKLTPMITTVNTRRVVAPLESKDQVMPLVLPGKVATVNNKPLAIEASEPTSSYAKVLVNNSVQVKYHKATSELGRVIQDTLHDIYVTKKDVPLSVEDKTYVDHLLTNIDKIFDEGIYTTRVLMRKIPDLPLIMPSLISSYGHRHVDSTPNLELWTRVHHILIRLSEVAKKMHFDTDSPGKVATVAKQFVSVNTKIGATKMRVYKRKDT